MRAAAFALAAALASAEAIVPAGAVHASVAASPARGDARAAARAVGERLAAVRGLTARFTQTLDAASLPGPQIEEGTLYLLRPGRMRWEYSRPAGKLALADGTRTWLYTPEDHQALSAPIDGGADQGVALLMREHPDLNAEFEASWSQERGAGVRPILALKPRSRDAPYDRLLVETDATGFPVALTVLDPLGGRVAYRLFDLRFADTLDPALFRFTPPKGVSIQEVGR